MSRTSATASAEFGRFVGWVVGVGVAMAALGYLPTRSFFGEAAVRAMLGAIAVTVLGSIIGGYPIFLSRLKAEAKPQVVMLSMLVRLVAVAALAALTAVGLDLATGPFLVWLALSYLMLLVIDSRYAMVALGQTE